MEEQQAKRMTRRSRPKLVVIAAMLVAVAGGFAAWSGLSWYSSAHDETIRFANARDDVLRVAQQELVNFYSLDYKDPDKSVNRMLDQATGTLADTLKQNKDNWRKQIQDGKASLSVKVVDAAVSELDERAGSASVVAMVEFVTSPGDGNPVRVPMQSAMTRTADGWKLSQAARIPLGAQGQ
ncbi:MAG: hypothetical protein JOZ47_00645 [Kutzneria sp.]|nr:hypothetical protein [Kutzneria sp.]